MIADPPVRARAIAVTMPVIPEIQLPGDVVAYCARVSNPGNQQNTETAPKLLKYLQKHRHWSPFEMAHMVIEIVTERDIAHQIVRHRSFAFQEFSQRYARVAKFHLREARLQDQKNRQSSLELSDSDEDIGLKIWWENRQVEMIEQAYSVYQQALDKGIAKEVARSVLPEGLTESTLYMAGTIRSWLHFLQARLDPSTQKEHRLVALACRDVVLEYFPDLKESVDD